MDVSFYGGRQAPPFTIYATYESKTDMEEAMKKIGEIPYGAYVLIDTKEIDIRNIENGNLYRKGLDGTPEFIGHLAGPVGYSPQVELADFNSLEKTGKPNEHFSENVLTVSENELIPGFQDEKEFNNITIRTLATREQNGEAEETLVKVGMQIPYHVFNIRAKAVSPYDKDTQQIIGEDYDEWMQPEVIRPFSSDWLLEIPHGVRGDGLTNVSIQRNTVDTIAESKLMGQYMSYTQIQMGIATEPKVFGYLNEISNLSLDKDYNLMVQYTANESGKMPEPQKIGNVRSEVPLKIGEEITINDSDFIFTQENIIEYLNQNRPNGELNLSEDYAASGTHGWIAAVKISETGAKELYAYGTRQTDASPETFSSSWFYIGTAYNANITIGSSNTSVADGNFMFVATSSPSRISNWSGVDPTSATATLEYEVENELEEEN